MKQKSTISERFANFKKNTKGMKAGEFVQYIKDYYLKTFLLFAAIFVTIIAIVVTAVINNNKDVILFGVGVNITLTDEGHKYITEDFLAPRKTKRNQTISYSSVIISESTDPNTTFYTIEGLSAQVDADRLDYFILNKSAMETLMPYDLYLDISEILTPAEMEKYKDIITIYAEHEETGKSFPVAIDISNTEFIKKNSITKEEYYFAFSVLPKNKAAAHDFFLYLMNYK